MSDPAKPAFEVRPVRPGEAVLIGNLLTDAFGGDAEPRLVAELRASDRMVLELVASDGSNVLGHIAFSRAEVGDGEAALKVTVLAPVAVRPDLQRRGIGAALVRAGLERLEAAGEDLVVVLGDPAYYPRFGFDPKLAEQVSAPWSGEAFMAVALSDGAAERLPVAIAAAPAFDALD